MTGTDVAFEGVLLIRVQHVARGREKDDGRIETYELHLNPSERDGAALYDAMQRTQ